MKRAIAIWIGILMATSIIGMFGEKTEAQTQGELVKPAWGNTNIVFGERIGISNATYLGSVTIDGHEVAYYKLLTGEHYVTSTPPSQQALDWNAIKNEAQISMVNLNISTGNNNETQEFGARTFLLSVGSELEGIECTGNYAYLTYKATSNNIQKRNLSDFSIVKQITIGDSTYYHVGGIIYDGNGHLWTVLAQPSDVGPSYVYEFDLNLNEITHWQTDNDHYGTVFGIYGNTIILGNWDCDQIAGFNITTHAQEWKVNTPAPFHTTQDVAYLGNNLYLGGRYRNNENYSTLYLYKIVNETSNGMVFLTNLISYGVAVGNPVGIDEQGYVYANGNDGLYKTKDVFLPLMVLDITGGDKYNIGFSDVWPCQDSGHEQWTVGGTGTDFAVAGEIHTGSISRTTVISGQTTGMFNVSYYGITTDVNGNTASGYGLIGGNDVTKFGAQTWGSATQNLQGSVYLTKAVPYVTYSQNSPPTCSLSASPTSGDAPLTVTFSMSASDSDGSIASWSLDVDNDGTAEYSDSDSPPSTQTHTYDNPGTYTAKLTVTDNEGATAYDTVTITVSSSSGNDNNTGGGWFTSSNGNTMMIIAIMAFAVLAMMMIVFASRRR